jgi:hypothetical protein
MKNSNRDFTTTHRLRLTALALASTLALVACGGGGGNPGTTGGTGAGTGTGTGTTPVTTPVATAPTVTVALVDAAGVASNALSAAAPLTARATVKDKDGKAVAGALVAFATDAKLALFTPSAGTSLTDTNGVATITLRPATLIANGAGTLTTTTTIGDATITGNATYMIGATTLTFGTLSASETSLAAYGSTNLSVDVLSNGASYTAQSVDLAFSSACVAAGKATMAAVVPTNGGKAQVVYRDKGCGNDDTITVNSDNVSKSASTSIKIAKPLPASVQFSTVSPVGKSIVIAGQGGLGRTETATLTFTVMDTFGFPLVGQSVIFTADTTLVKLNKLTDTTDALGQVTTSVNSGAQPTAFKIKATLPNGASVQSDSVAVTTGLPDQAHFSISATLFNLDGLYYDSGTTTPASNINVLLADQNGNPVTDGVSVVFSSNLGAIGTSNQGSCNTVNGGCSVDFRTQSPHVATPGVPATPCNTGDGSSPDSTRPGVATVCASISDGKTTLFKRIGLFFSGNKANAILNGTTPVTATASNPFDLGSIVRTDSKNFTLQFNDENGNPMPAGSSVTVTDVAGGLNSGSVSPIVVANIPPPLVTVAGNLGSTHTFTIVPVPPPTTGCSSSKGTFNVVIVTSPGTTHSVTTTFPFKLAVTCS